MENYRYDPVGCYRDLPYLWIGIDLPGDVLRQKLPLFRGRRAFNDHTDTHGNQSQKQIGTAQAASARGKHLIGTGYDCFYIYNLQEKTIDLVYNIL